MTDFELFLACLLIPAAYAVIYIAGKYDMLALICKMLERKCKEIEQEEEKEFASDTNIGGKWILTEKELPPSGTYVYASCHSLVDDGEDWVSHTFYFNGIWGIPIADCGKAEVIAWMEAVTPAPYRKEK